jgi:hypothetical protein
MCSGSLPPAALLLMLLAPPASFSCPPVLLGCTAVERLITFRDVMRGRSNNWDQAMSTWT